MLELNMTKGCRILINIKDILWVQETNPTRVMLRREEYPLEVKESYGQIKTAIEND